MSLTELSGKKEGGKLFSIGNPLMIHVAAEAIVIMGVGFYFNKKINSLQEELEEVKKVVSQHDQILRQIVGNMNPNREHFDQSQMPQQHEQHPQHHHQHHHPQQIHQRQAYRPPLTQDDDSDDDDDFDPAVLDQELDREFAELEEEPEPQPKPKPKGDVEFISDEDAERLKSKGRRKKHKKKRSN